MIKAWHENAKKFDTPARFYPKTARAASQRRGKAYPAGPPPDARDPATGGVAPAAFDARDDRRRRLTFSCKPCWLGVLLANHEVTSQSPSSSSTVAGSRPPFAPGARTSGACSTADPASAITARRPAIIHKREHRLAETAKSPPAAGEETCRPCRPADEKHCQLPAGAALSATCSFASSWCDSVVSRTLPPVPCRAVSSFSGLA